MTAGKMHDDEVDTDASRVARWITIQFPQWAELPIEPVPSAGTDNALYRLGADMVVRLPRIQGATGQVTKEPPYSGSIPQVGRLPEHTTLTGVRHWPREMLPPGLPSPPWWEILNSEGTYLNHCRSKVSCRRRRSAA
jgi:hypothetical protein